MAFKFRKHRIMVEVTLDRPITAKAAARALRDVMEWADKDHILGRCDHDASIVKFDVKEGNRVEAGIDRACVAAVAQELGV